jgi:hypothetical protein
MVMKAKRFDCVEMKHRAQEKLRAEYEARREEFSSYSEFLAATIDEDPWQRALWQRISPPAYPRPRRDSRTPSP